MNLADVMDEVAARLDTIDGLRCFAQPPGKITPPGAFVDYPENIAFDATYGRGSDRMTLPVALLVGKVVDRSARDQLGAYADGSGAKSIKTVLESGTYTAFDEVTVQRVDFDPVRIAGVDYMAALFTLDIIGPGSG